MLHSQFGRTPINILLSKDKKSCPLYREFGLQCAWVSQWIFPGKEHHFQKLLQPRTLLSGNSHPPPMEKIKIHSKYRWLSIFRSSRDHWKTSRDRGVWEIESKNIPEFSWFSFFSYRNFRSLIQYGLLQTVFHACFAGKFTWSQQLSLNC